jgi:lysophospholipase L1-like esterase
MPARMNCALVFAFGLNDCVVLDGLNPRVEPAQTAINARAILSEARAWLPSIFIGPAPVDDTRPQPFFISGKQFRVRNTQVAETNQILAQVMTEIDVPYLDVFTRLVENQQWRELMKQGDGVHPPSKGYDLLAEAIGNWEPWRQLIGESSTV